MTPSSAPQGPRKRRHFSPVFKAEIVAQCRQPKVSVSRIALDNGLNANMVRRWMREAERANTPLPIPAFVPVQLPAPHRPAQIDHSVIRIECTRPSGTVVVEWPVDQAQPCLALLRDLLS